MTELQPSESLKIIQEIIQQRKQKYEANGFFLLFWGALIALRNSAVYNAHQQFLP